MFPQSNSGCRSAAELCYVWDMRKSNTALQRYETAGGDPALDEAVAVLTDYALNGGNWRSVSRALTVIDQRRPDLRHLSTDIRLAFMHDNEAMKMRMVRTACGQIIKGLNGVEV